MKVSLRYSRHLVLQFSGSALNRPTLMYPLIPNNQINTHLNIDFEITYLVATLIYKARGISSCFLRALIHHKVLRWHWLVHGYWCLSSCVCPTMDFWTSYNEFITCFHETWIYKTWFIFQWNLSFALMGSKWIFI